jgi:hypothetical protein
MQLRSYCGRGTGWLPPETVICGVDWLPSMIYVLHIDPS